MQYLNLMGVPASTGGLAVLGSFAGCALNLFGMPRPSQSLRNEMTRRETSKKKRLKG